MTPQEATRHDRTLLAVVTQYQTLAMIALGKIQDPTSGEVARDLAQARVFIDILEMLKVKCRTGTPEEILRLLDGAVMDLQLNFLDEQKKEAEAARGASDQGADESAAGPDASGDSPENPDGEDAST